MHVQKCGGISIHEAIRRSYGLRARIAGRSLFSIDAPVSASAASFLGVGTYAHRRHLLVYHLGLPRARYVSGHVPCPPDVVERFSDRWRFVTMLRHPVDRWFSHYFFDRYKKDDHRRTDLDLEDYASSPEGLRQGSAFVQFLTGRDPDDATSVDAIETALDNLARFAVVGLLEDVSRFEREFEAELGVRLRIPRRNASPLPAHRRRGLVTGGMRRRVEEICAPDLRLHAAWLRRRGL